MSGRPTTDIVEQLRAGHDSIDLRGEAADEIERLRERNNGLEIAHRQMGKTLDNAYAEIAELRNITLRVIV